MKYQCCIVILVVAGLWSCNSNYTPHHYDKQLLGHWTFVKSGKIAFDRMGNNIMKPGVSLKKGIVYSFLPNGFCENKVGYYYNNPVTHSTSFLGNTTSYKMVDDSLGIYDLSKRKWQWMKVYYMDADTMILKYGDTAYVKAAKAHQN